MLADEVEHQARLLGGVMAQPAPELLQEQRRALRRTQQQQRVDERQVDALVVEVAREQHVDGALLQARRRVLAIGAVGVHRERGQPARREVRRHELRVLDADAEGERANGSPVRDASFELRQDAVGARGVPGVDVAERGEVVAGPRPAHVPQVHAVVDAVVLERHEELVVERVPQAKLGRDVAVEVGQQRLAVAALGGRREPDEDLRLQPRHDLLVRLRGHVMALVDDHVSEVARAELADQVARRRALDAREHVLPALGLVRADEQLAERRQLQRVAERLARLIEQLLAVREEQQPRRCPGGRRDALVVERRDHGLAGAGRRDDEVAAAAVQRALGDELVEDGLLERQRAELDEEPVGLVGRRLARERTREPRALLGVVGVVGLELDVVPQRVERALELVDDVRQVGGADLHHPLLAGR